jgi:hypothetical protein
MAFTDYASLKTEIVTWAMRTGDEEYEAAVPGFIALAEKRLSRSLRVAEMETVATVNLTDGAGPLPADFQQARCVTAGVSPPSVLRPLIPSFARSRFPENYGGYPRFYTITGNTITTFPASTGDLTLDYYAAIPPLSDTNTTNWLLEQAPDLYLYGALLEGTTFMLDDPRLQTWTLLFQKGVTDLQNADKGKRWAGSRARVSGPTP